MATAVHKGLSISVVMPAYNESAGVRATVEDFINQPCVDEVIVVDNNSTDGTGEIAAAAGAKVIRELRQGYGFACRAGLAAARGDLVVLTESDNSFYADDLEIMLPYMPYFDIVKGARSNHHLITDDADWTYGLLLGNWFVAKYLQVLYLWKRSVDDASFREVGGTFRIIRREALDVILPLLTEGQSALLPDMVTIALRKNLRLLEIPVRYRRRLGESKITGNRFRAFLLALRMARIITHNRWRSL
ncbi:MAG TPA: glycosyltransferase family 2 protein [Thermoanaerobaculia bacterium]|nr:glycosyltransferase family 2 protein [Thermoanaerobaculia bacterium]